MTDLSYEAKWSTVIALEDWLGPNKYECKIYFDIETENAQEQNTAFERCKVILEHIMDNALLINMDNPLVQILNKKTQQKIICLPNEPLDVIVAAVIYYKLNAITEGRLAIKKVKLRSTQGDNIWIHFDEDFANEFTGKDAEFYKTVQETAWWFRSDPSACDWFELKPKQKELKFHFHKSVWDKTLRWDKTEDSSTNSKIQWQPRVIDGGKETKH